MPTLPSELRSKLERVVTGARDAAEAGARAALEAMAVHYREPYPHMNPAQRELRNHLRARARQLGDRQDAFGRLAIDRLAGECAYEHWHRMLFARFLAENNLLIEPEDNVAISLTEAEELATEEGVGVWVYASRCAQRILPQIFRPDDPLLHVSFATEYMLKLEELLATLPAAVFTASDALGWVYQFWQSRKKDEVNRSEVKIGPDEISAVTQLFTEPYMVEFLIHNTLGAWWAGKRLGLDGAANANTEAELRAKVTLPGIAWDYLRFVRGADGQGGPWRPAAGTFDGWPRNAAELRILDLCCGSGHFLVAALHHLVPIRMAEEGLSRAEAVDAVLRENLHGLEIDERCCQIAAFAVALSAWTYPDAGGYRTLPDLHIACTGIGPQSTQEQWVKLVDQSGSSMAIIVREEIKNGLLGLHWLFSQAPTLGSLINPAKIPADLIAAGYETIQPYLAAAMSAEMRDYDIHERAVAAAGMVKAADMLASKYTLVITNVPYLGRGKQSESLKVHIDKYYPEGKADLATAFIMRCLEFCAPRCSVAVVTPQNWYFLPAYRSLRERLLRDSEFNLVVRLGANAFRDMNFWAATTALNVLTATAPSAGTWVVGIDASRSKEHAYKVDVLRNGTDAAVVHFQQPSQLSNPDARISMEAPSAQDRLAAFAISPQGTKTGDDARLRRMWWEVTCNGGRWRFLHGAPDTTRLVDGATCAIDFRDGETAFARPQGQAAWGRQGVVVKLMGGVVAARYLGNVFDSNVTAVVPKVPAHLPAIWAFITHPDFEASLRKIEQAVKVNNATVSKVPFDLEHWQRVAAKQYPSGLPDPETDDPTQWVFHGQPGESTDPVQVAVVRLLGYRWPAELDDKLRLSKRARALVHKCSELAKFACSDGIVCIPAVRGEDPAAERLLRLLSACGIEPGADLEDWLRNGFFEEHCRLFHDHPFVWHIWDGRKRDGFHALVSYHKLCEAGGKGRRLLESLTYAYLGEWITRQKDGVKRGEGGAEDRLAAALELQSRLEAILEGEPPFDIFVRWKPLAQQPIGWGPDVNDGVRLNIRPFLVSDVPNGRAGAGILRWKPNIKWTKDRGKEPDRPKTEYPWFWGWDEKTKDFMGSKTFDGNRWNDCHYTNKVKQAARDAAKKGGK